MADAGNDQLVADSEDDAAFTELPPVKGASATNPGHSTFFDTSVIQTAAFTPDRPRTPQKGLQSPSRSADESLFTPPPARMNIAINNPTSVPSTSDAPSIIAPRPRPRPRVIIRKAVASDHNADVASTSFSHISDPPISTTRTNDSIHPATTTPFDFSEAVGDAYLSFGIAERAKMRSRKKTQTAKKPIPPQDQMNEIIELTSDEDELAFKPTKRQKKQGNPKPKAPTRAKPAQKLKPATVIPSDSPSSSAVVGFPDVPPAHYASPSQPPASTLPTIPPSTPPQARESTPLSSPLVTTRKRKKIRHSIAEGDDELDIIGSNPIGVSLLPPEPPPFFAPSSSSFPTDSGVEIPPVESLTGRGKKKQSSSSKKGTQTKARNKGKRGKEVEMTSATVEIVEEPAAMTQEPSIPAASHSPSERHPQVIRNSTATRKASGKQSVAKKGKARVIDSCEEEDEPAPQLKSVTARTPPADEGEGERSKENLQPDDLSPPKRDPPEHTSTTSSLHARGPAVKPKLTPMSELIRRVNSQPNSPFPNASRTYSPLLKSSRTMLSRIAPLHTNRRTPPPPPPRPPPPKKSKKQLEMEERIDEELAETIEGWSCLADEERRALRKARIDAELGYE